MRSRRLASLTGRRAVLLGVVAAVILAAAVAIRLAYVDATPGLKLVNDALDYDGHAVSIATVGHYSDTLAYGRPTAFRPPGYPYALAAVYKAAGVARAGVARRVDVARRMQVVIGTVLVAMIGLLAAQLWGPVAALVSMGLAAVYVPLVTMSGTVMSEPLFDVFMIGSLSAAIAHRRSVHRFRWAVASGLLVGLAILTRANALILLLPLVLAVWDRRPRWSVPALAPPVALALVAVFAVAPWTIRNERALHHFVPVSTQLGSALAGTYTDEARTDPVRPASHRRTRGGSRTRPRGSPPRRPTAGPRDGRSATPGGGSAQQRPAHAAAVILAAAFAIRLAYVDATPGMKLVNDALDYDGHAVSIATVGHYSDTLAYGRPTAWPS